MDGDFIPMKGNNAGDVEGQEDRRTGKSKLNSFEDEPLKKKVSLLTDITAPWLDYAVLNIRGVAPLVRFHNEILSFCKYVTPSKAEILNRKKLFNEISTIATTLWPNCSVRVFGSQLSKVLTPSSDLDVTILNVTEDSTGVIKLLTQLADVIRDRKLASYLETIVHAKVRLLNSH